MAEFRPFDLGSVYRTAALVREARTSNALREAQLGELERKRAEANAIAKASTEAMGDDGSIDVQRLAGAFMRQGRPKRAMELMKLHRELSDPKPNALDKVKLAREVFGLVKDAAPLIDSQPLYDSFRSLLERTELVEPGLLPPRWSQEARDALMGVKRRAEKHYRTLSSEEAAARGLPKGGVYQIEEGTGRVEALARPRQSEFSRLADAAGLSPEERKATARGILERRAAPKDGPSSTFRAAAAEVLGGAYDPIKEIIVATQGGEPIDTAAALAVAARAERIYRDANGKIGPINAAYRAAQELGYAKPERFQLPAGSNPSDPLNIRRTLMPPRS